MRWKWRLGLLLTAAVEVPFLLWISVVIGTPSDIVLYVGGILTMMLLTTLALRPILFGMLSAWLGGLAGAAWYFLRYVPPALALGFGAVLSTLVCAIGAPLYHRIMGFLLRHRM